MNQRSLFVVLFAVLFAACEDDSTLFDLNAVRETKYSLLAGAEYALRAADQADTLAARLAVFTSSAAVFSDSAYAHADSTLSAETLFAANAYAARFALSKAANYTDYATRDGGDDVVYEACDAVLSSAAATTATEAYKVARRAAAAAFQSYAAAYDARNARLAPRAYKVAWGAAEKTASIARRAASIARHAADQVATVRADRASADSLYAAAQAEARYTAEDYTTYIDSADADEAPSNKAARLRRAYKKDAAEQAAEKATAAHRAAEQAAEKATVAHRAAEQAAEKAAAAHRAAEQAAKVYAEQAVRLHRAYKKDAVQAAYDVACATAYDAAYQTYNDDDGLDDADKDAWNIVSDASIDFLRFPDKAKRYVYATYVDPAAIAVAYETASDLFDAAYRADSDDPQAYAAEAYAAAAKEAGRIAARDSVYVKSPISIAIAALAASGTAYRAYATYIDSILKFHYVTRQAGASNLFERLETEDIIYERSDVNVSVDALIRDFRKTAIVQDPDEHFEGSMTEFEEKSDKGDWLIIDKSGFFSNEVLAMQKMAVERDIKAMRRSMGEFSSALARMSESPEDSIGRIRRNLREAVQVISSPENKANEEVSQVFAAYVEDPESEYYKEILRSALEERLGDKETAQKFLDFLETEEGWKAMSPFATSIFTHQYKDIPLMQKRDGRR